MFNALTYWPRSKNYHIIENSYIIITVEKCKENIKWGMDGKLFKNLIY